jgi:hypothetical protein
VKPQTEVLIVPIFLLLTFAGCKKASDSPTYYLSFQVGTKTYTADSAWAIRNSPVLHSLTIRIRPAQINVDSGRYISGNFYADNNSSTDTSFTGTYGCALSPPAKSICGSSLRLYLPNDANYGNFGAGTNGFTFTVTESNATFVSGNFNGLFGALPITNGKFKVVYKF